MKLKLPGYPALILLIVCVLFMSYSGTYAAQFEELERNPEGAHKGQILLGALGNVGGVLSPLLQAEDGFIKYSTYTFAGTTLTKSIKVTHLTFGYGLFFEYMPVDHLGVRFEARRSSVMQRSLFGSQYKNWSKLLYGDYSVMAGLSAHVTNRKQWDIVFSPMVGYYFGEYRALPVAHQLMLVLGPNRMRVIDNYCLGGEVQGLIYFSRGFILSLGFDWMYNKIDFKNSYYLMNYQTNALYFINKRMSYFHSLSVFVSAGYAFSN